MIVTAHFVARWLERVEGKTEFADMVRLNPEKTEVQLLQIYLGWHGQELLQIQNELAAVLVELRPRTGFIYVNNRKWWVVIKDNAAITIAPSGTQEANMHLVKAAHKKLVAVRKRRKAKKANRQNLAHKLQTGYN